MRIEGEGSQAALRAVELSFQPHTQSSSTSPQPLAPSPSSPITVAEVNTRAEFMQLQGEWNDLVQSTLNELFARHEMIRVWLDNFAPLARLRVLTGRDSEGRLVAALPLVEKHTRQLGLPVRSLLSPTNDQIPRFDMVAEDAEAAGQAFLRYLAGDDSWDMLRLNNVPEGGRGWGLYRAAYSAGYPTATWLSFESPYVPLPATHKELQAGLSSKFRANVRRRHRKLAEQGSVTVEKVEGGLVVPAKLEEGLALERSGWKGRGGTAIAQDRHIWGYYAELARFAEHNCGLALYFLRLNGKPVAFHYAITYGSTYHLLKPAYSEAVAECSPGQLLVDRVLCRSVAEKLGEFDFLGPDMVWKSDWTQHTRPHHWLFIFRDSPYGRLLRDYKFVWARRARQAATSRRRAR